MEIPNSAKYRLIRNTPKDGSKVEIEAEIAHEHLAPFKKRVLDSLRNTLDIAGFRQGKATDEVIEKHVGTFAILEKTAGEALAHIYPQILADHDIDAVGHPHISITKLAPENALVFVAETSVMPAITLTDYKGSAETATKALSSPDLLVTNEEVEQSLMNLRKRIAHTRWHEEHPDDEGHGHGNIPDADLPVITDELAKQIGYKDIAEVNQEARKALEEDKANREKSRRRAAIGDQLVKDTPFTIPDLFVDGELSMMLGEFRQTLAHMGTTLDDYLKNIKKTQDDLKNEWRGDAEKRARLQLILNRIAEKEKLIPSEEQIQHEVAHLIEHHPNAKEENIRSYVESIMRNDLVFDFLEGKKEEK